MSGDRIVARGSAGRSVSGGFGGRDWLAIQLRGVTGIDDVVPEKRPGTDASVMVRIDKAQSTERLSLQWRPEGLVLGTWPAELMKQAEATYRTGRGQRVLDFAAGTPAGWRVRPHVHLAYHSASILQRVYLHCDLDLDEYVHRWLGEDFEYVRGYHCDHVRPVLWPWLRERGYASDPDESQLPGFLDRLGKRDAHLRPAIRIKRTWSRAEAASLDHAAPWPANSVRRSRNCWAFWTSRFPLPAPRGAPDGAHCRARRKIGSRVEGDAHGALPKRLHAARPLDRHIARTLTAYVDLALCP